MKEGTFNAQAQAGIETACAGGQLCQVKAPVFPPNAGVTDTSAWAESINSGSIWFLCYGENSRVCSRIAK